jgi:hypothetical protein
MELVLSLLHLRCALFVVEWVMIALHGATRGDLSALPRQLRIKKRGASRPRDYLCTRDEGRDDYDAPRKDPQWDMHADCFLVLENHKCGVHCAARGPDGAVQNRTMHALNTELTLMKVRKILQIYKEFK